MATDQPTPPNLGNLSDAAFLALIDWDRTPTDPLGGDDTWVIFQECLPPLFYRLVRENFRYLNLALACDPSTPTPLGIAAKLTDESRHWLATDSRVIPVLGSTAIGLAEQPSLIYSCNGTEVDDLSGVIDIEVAGVSNNFVYAVVSRNHEDPGPSGQDGTLGLRNHQERWYYLNDNTIVRQHDIAIQMSVQIPEWPEDTASPIILAKVAHIASTSDVGLNRIGFEFGLGHALAGDALSSERDYALYLKWFDSSNVEQRAVCVTAAGDAISITPGRRITLAFHRYDSGAGNWAVAFYASGVQLGATVSGFAVPDVSTLSDVRMHVGSAQLGRSYVGGPISSVTIWDNPASIPNLESAIAALYQRSEQFLGAP